MSIEPHGATTGLLAIRSPICKIALRALACTGKLRMPARLVRWEDPRNREARLGKFAWSIGIADGVRCWLIRFANEPSVGSGKPEEKNEKKTRSVHAARQPARWPDEAPLAGGNQAPGQAENPGQRHPCGTDPDNRFVVHPRFHLATVDCGIPSSTAMTRWLFPWSAN